MAILFCWMLAITVEAVLAVQPRTQPSDITSINSLHGDKEQPVDPKLRRALLRVLARIREEEMGELPPDAPKDDILRVLGEPAEAQDLGSLEDSQESRRYEFMEPGAKPWSIASSMEQLKDERPNLEAVGMESVNLYIEPIPATESPKETELKEATMESNEPSIEYKEISVESVKPVEKRIGMTLGPLKIHFGDRITTNPENVNNGSQSSEIVIIKSNNDKSYFPQIKVQKDQIEDSNGKQRDTVEAEEYRNDIMEHNNEYNQEPPEDSMNGLAKPSTNVENISYNVDSPRNEEPVGMNSNDKNNYIVEELQSEPTQPTPDKEVFFHSPTPIDIPDVEDPRIPLQNVASKEEKKIEKVIGEEEEEDKPIKNIEKEEKKENVKHEVEFLSSPLVAAFTVQQDEKGVPRRIIPIDYGRPPPSPTEDPEQAVQRQRELEEKEYLLQQQLRLLQEERNRYNRGGNQGFLLQPSIPSNHEPQQLVEYQRNVEHQRQQEHWRNQQQLVRQQEIQRQLEIQRLQELKRQQEFQRFQELQLQTEHRFRAPFGTRPQQIEFQKSIDLRLPNFEQHNRVNRKEPSYFVSNFGVNHPAYPVVRRPHTFDSHLQSLISQAGIVSGLPRNTQDDLGIVSKVLALNHGTFPEDGLFPPHHTSPSSSGKSTVPAQPS